MPNGLRCTNVRVYGEIENDSGFGLVFHVDGG